MLTEGAAVDSANRLRPVLLRLARQLRRELGPVGITGGQAALLHHIRSEPGAGIAGLAEREGMSVPGMSAAVTRLEAAGLVRRTRADGDRRRVGLALTDEGERVLAEARSRRTAWLAERIERLSPEERGAVDAAAGALARLLEAGA